MRGLREAAALLLPVLATALVIPAEEFTDRVFSNPTFGANPSEAHRIIEYNLNNGFVKFNLPCPGCSDEEREAIEHSVVTLSIPATQEACIDESGVIHYDGESSHKRGFELTIENDRRLEEAIKKARGFWTISCACLMNEPGQACPPEVNARILVFSLRDIGQHPHPGFTVTYTQEKNPRILQLSLSPDDEALFDLSRSRHWQNPTLASVSNPTIPMLNIPLYHSSLLDSSFSNPTHLGPNIPIPTESTVTRSTVMTISREPPTATHAAEVVEASSRVLAQPSPEATATSISVEETQTRESSGVLEQVLKVEAKAMQLVQSVIGSEPADPLLSSSKPEDISDGNEPVAHNELGVNEEPSSTPTTASSPMQSVDLSPPLETRESDLLGFPNPTLSEVSDHPSYRTDQVVRALQLTSLIIIIISLLSTIFIVFFRNPRRRADRAARCEERQRRRLYKRAARRHKWHTWYQRIRGKVVPVTPEPVALTWEEKQTQVLRSDGASLAQMRRELRALRAAHTVVDGIVRAEEGRNDSNSSVPYVVSSQRRVRSFSDSTVASAGLPSYEESITVGSGYQYTPEATDNTPDSSVIDTSPRTSIYMRDSDSEKE